MCQCNKNDSRHVEGGRAAAVGVVARDRVRLWQQEVSDVELTGRQDRLHGPFVIGDADLRPTPEQEIGDGDRARLRAVGAVGEVQGTRRLGHEIVAEHRHPERVGQPGFAALECLDQQVDGGRVSALIAASVADRVPLASASKVEDDVGSPQGQ